MMPPNITNGTNPNYNPNHQNYFARNHRQRGLPPPAELSQRVEEAKTSAKLLSQVVQSTPPSEVLNNELIKEFDERCQSASRSIQGYIHSDNPPPDEDTLLTLIETNDQLATAMSRHQRAMLQARRATGPSPRPSPNPPPTQNGPFEAPTNPPPRGPQGLSFAAPSGLPLGKQTQHAPQTEPQNPFGDHNEHSDELPPPPLPAGYGMPPSTIGKENDQGAVFRPGYHEASSSYGSRPEALLGNGTARGGEEEGGEVRRPVQYRF